VDAASVRDFRKSPRDRVDTGRFWRYDGIGWPRSTAEIRPWNLAVVVVVALTIWGYISIGPNGRLEPGRPELHRTDFTVFTEAGAAFFDGRDPYEVANPRGWHYLYPPLFALLVAPLSLFDTESQVVIWFVINVAFAFGCFVEARKLWRLVAGAVPRRSRFVVSCTGIAAFLPFLDCMQAGQLGIAILYLLTLGLRLSLQYRSRSIWFLAGVILALPAAIKLVPALPVAFLLLNRWLAVAKPDAHKRPWAQAAGLTSGVLTGVLLYSLAIPASLIGWHSNLDHLSRWREQVVMNERVGPNANFNIHSFRNQSLANAIYLCHKAAIHGLATDSRPTTVRDRPERIVHPAVRVLIGFVLALLLSVGVLLGRRTDALDQATAYALACCAILLVSPVSWGHYYMSAALAVLFVPTWLLRLGRPIEARLAAVIPPILSWSYYVAMPYTGGIGLLGLGTTVWFVGVCGLILWNELARTRGAAKAAFREVHGRLPAGRISPLASGREIGAPLGQPAEEAAAELSSVPG
jgi:hypothetical protein